MLDLKQMEHENLKYIEHKKCKSSGTQSASDRFLYVKIAYDILAYDHVYNGPVEQH